ncbi:MAG: recombinase family protein [bacterium]|nr:recombinase family protein [bacterium]
MSKPNTKAAGYVRVSSKEQTDNESLSTQRQSIKNFAKQHGWKLTDIYADEGISGGSVKDRHALQQCLHDGQDGKFDVLVIPRLSRFGRNARELLNNHEELQKVGIQLHSISEGIDFSNRYGKAMLGLLSVIGELELDIIRETMLENRIARGKKGIPTAGNLPFARTFDKETGEWDLDEKVAGLMRWAAAEYLKGGSLRAIAETLRTRHGLRMAYDTLLRALSQRCGDTWTVNFKDEEPITYEVPRILDEETIRRVRERVAHNRVQSRQDVRKYVLTGFIRSELCGHTLSGQTQTSSGGGVYAYYKHPGGKHRECKVRFGVKVALVENAVFRTIFENTVDAPAFERAIAESLPDERLIKSLEKQVKAMEKELKRIGKELDTLVDLALSGTLAKGTIRGREQSLLKAKEEVVEELEATREKLRSMPDLDEAKAEAYRVRRQLLEHYGSEERLQAMSFDEKKQLLHWLFDGKDQSGTPYGIYVTKRGRDEFDYFLYGRITGLRTMKGDDINHDPESDSRYISSEALVVS